MSVNNLIQRIQSQKVVLAACGMLAFVANQKVCGDEKTRPPYDITKTELADKELAENNLADAKPTTMMDENAEDESPALGVVVGSCPGDAVCVLDTILGSPADDAGVRQGDYILSVNDKKVTSPKELKEAIEESAAGTQVTLTVWRNDIETKKQVTLASKADEMPAMHRAWLGVKLAPAQQGDGVMIEEVLRDSPAAAAGLRSGDTITKQGDKPVTAVQSFIESVEDMGPGSEMQLTVQRAGKDQQISATLGEKSEAPMQFHRSLLSSMNGMDNNQQSAHSMEMMDETIDEMRQQIRELSNEIRELKSANPKQPRPAEDDDLSKSDSLTDGAITLVVDRDGRWDNRSWNRGRNWDNNYYDWRNQYRSSYRAPLYRSPGYGNSYYRYGGQPYYGNFGNNYGYGYGYGRSGVRIGNFGVWW